MGTAGKATILDSGKFCIPASSGYGAIKDATGQCVECCPDEVPTGCPCDSGEWAALVSSGTPCGGLVQQYQIKDYDDGDPSGTPTLETSSPCTNCDDSSATLWGGVFTALSGSPCVWSEEDTLQIDGKELEPNDTRLALDTSGDPDVWSITVFCHWDGDPADGEELIWAGSKVSGSTPVGIYTRSDGCDTTSTLEIEEV